jgi:hypothetical protein
MEGIPMLKNLSKPGDFLTKIDLKDAYLSVLIWPPHQKFLRLPTKNFYGVEKRDVGFSMSSLRTGKSPPNFHKIIIKASCGSLKRNGHQAHYILGRHPNNGRIKGTGSKTHSCGSQSIDKPWVFVISNEKSMFEPTQVIELLCFCVDSMLMSLSLPLGKRYGLSKRNANIS